LRLLQLVEHEVEDRGIVASSDDRVGNPPDLQKPPVVGHDLAPSIDDQNPVGGRIERGSQESQRVLDLSFRLFALGDVQRDADDTADLPAPVAQRVEVSGEASAPPFELIDDRLPPERTAVIVDSGKILIRRRKVLVEALPNEALGVVAKDRKRAAGQTI